MSEITKLLELINEEAEKIVLPDTDLGCVLESCHSNLIEQQAEIEADNRNAQTFLDSIHGLEQENNQLKKDVIRLKDVLYQIKTHMDQSESPFYEGMKLLNEHAKKEVEYKPYLDIELPDN